MFTICILSWKAHQSLINTLDSYRDHGLLDHPAPKFIFFQEISEQDITIARKYNIEYRGTKENIGIDGAWEDILTHITTPYVLFLEDDCPLIMNREQAYLQLQASLQLLQEQKADIVRLRSRWQPGYKFNILAKYQRFFADNIYAKLLRFFRPKKASRLLGAAIYAHQNPEKIHSEILKNGDFYIVDSAHLNWTNQSVMLSKDLFLKELLPYIKTHPSSRKLNGRQNLENSLNCRWWRKQQYKIAIHKDGLFTHVRID